MMNERHLLLLSSSRAGDSGYLIHALPMISQHLGKVNKVLFIPFAGVTMSYQDYTNMVQQALSQHGITVNGIHEFEQPKEAIAQAEAIIVGGGNTFRLLERLYHFDLLTDIKEKVSQGTPYIGWSAGSNIAGQTIKTTNDMPIVEPPSFNALNLVNFQLNPHYSEYSPPGFNGETREQRLNEFMVLNNDTTIVALEEGSALIVSANDIQLVTADNISANGYLFHAGKKSLITKHDDLAHLR